MIAPVTPQPEPAEPYFEVEFGNEPVSDAAVSAIARLLLERVRRKKAEQATKEPQSKPTAGPRGK